jgi:hypothetical protein
MPNLPISGLPSLATPEPSDVFAIVNNGVTKKTTVQSVGTAVFTQISSSLVSTSSFNSFTSSYNNATGSFGVTSYYGSFFHTASIVLSVASASYSASFSTTDFAYGVSISGSNNDKIKIANAGVYNIQFSAQLDKTNSSNATVYIWLRKNNIDVPISNTGVAIFGGANEALVAAWNFFVSASANDYYQLMFAATDNNIRVLYSATPSFGPAIPSLILTVNRIA